jgi:sulfatase maturation enzyme AslB (radical SAM superfamily)
MNSSALVFNPSRKSRPLPEKGDYRHFPEDFDISRQLTIETGYFVFTMMPSLRCSLNCPHCYLSLDQRRNSKIMSVEELEAACKKVRAYYDTKNITRKVIIFYWYGGEPTEMGLPYMLDAFSRIDKIFPESEGYYVRHDILTSLLMVDPEWFDVFKTWGRGHFQTSFDGLMRGKGYVKKWHKKVKEAIDYGLSVSTISVVNNELFKDGPEEILAYLADLGVEEASFLPFMLNEQNEGDKYEKFAPPMDQYSDFMIKLSREWYRRKNEGLFVPQIGQMNYVSSRSNLPEISNIAAQTLFLLPEGDFVLPDYKNGYLEFMRPFGNIFKQSFDQVLNSVDRQAYLRKQLTRNMNPECLSCDYKNNCIMEFWKENREGDDCFGARKFVEWIVNEDEHQGILSKQNPVMF